MREVYLDYNATTPVDEEVLKAMLPYFRERFGNASGIYYRGEEARGALEESRAKVARVINARPQEIIFTGGGSEADNLAIKGLALAQEEKRHIITTSIEHHAVLFTCRYLEKRGFSVTYLPVDEHGFVDPDDVQKAICPGTFLVTIMHANNEVGVIEPLEEIGRILKGRGIIFHTDAVQSFGKIPINVEVIDVDMLSTAAHKIYGPKGVGFLYMRKGVRLDPLIHGGHHEMGMRAGTMNVAGIVGFGKAAEIASYHMEEEGARIRALRDRLYSGIVERVPQVFCNTHLQVSMPNTLNLCFEGIEGESMVLMLSARGICVSSGSACTSESLEPSHVLSAMGIKPQLARTSLRLSLGWFTTEEDVDYVLGILPQVVQNLREMSPLGA